MAFQELFDEAMRDLLKKHGIPASLQEAFQIVPAVRAWSSTDGDLHGVFHFSVNTRLVRFSSNQCPLWVISGHFALRERCALPSKADI